MCVTSFMDDPLSEQNLKHKELSDLILDNCSLTFKSVVGKKKHSVNFNVFPISFIPKRV